MSDFSEDIADVLRAVGYANEVKPAPAPVEDSPALEAPTLSPREAAEMILNSVEEIKTPAVEEVVPVITPSSEPLASCSVQEQQKEPTPQVIPSAAKMNGQPMEKPVPPPSGSKPIPKAPKVEATTQENPFNEIQIGDSKILLQCEV